MKKFLSISIIVLIAMSLITCKSSKSRKVAKLDEKTKKYWKWNSATGGEW